MSDPIYAPPVARPQVLVDRDPEHQGMWQVECFECDWSAGPSVKTYVQELAVLHRREHRAGRVRVG